MTKLSRIARLTSIAALLCLSAARIAMAEPAPNTLPTGFNTLHGTVTVHPSGNAMTIEQQSNRAVIEWSNFDIGRDASVTFQQPNSKSIAVNRVDGGNDPTQIYGQLKANGRLVILDQNGIVFGSGSKVDTSGLIAATGRIENAAEFYAGEALRVVDMDGKNAQALISNAGNITAAEGGLVALVAPRLRNSGIIQAHLGQVSLANGRVATVDFHGDGLVQLAVAGPLNATVLTEFINNSGHISADGGKVYMTVQSSVGLVNKAINNTGIISARRASLKDGAIVLESGNAKEILNNAVYAGTNADIQSIIDAPWESAQHNIYLAGGQYHQSLALGEGTLLHSLKGDSTLSGDGSHRPTLAVSGNNVGVVGLVIENENGLGLYAEGVQNLSLLANGFREAPVVLNNTAATLFGNTFIYNGKDGPLAVMGSGPVKIFDSRFMGGGQYAVKTEQAASVSVMRTQMLQNFVRELWVSGGADIDDRHLRPAGSTPPAAPAKDAEIVILPAGGMTAAALASIAPAAGGDAATCNSDEGSGCQ